MSYEKKEYKPMDLTPGNGALFANKNSKSEMSPHYMGEIEIPSDMTGRVRISLWKKTSKAGNTYLSVSLWKPTQKGQQQAPAKRAPEPKDDFNDDIPF